MHSVKCRHIADIFILCAKISIMHYHELVASYIKSKYSQQLHYLCQPILYCLKNVQKYYECSLKVLIEVMMKNEVFWYVTPRRLVSC